MSKRTTPVLVALALAGGVIAGCGGGDDSGGSADSGARDTASRPQGAPPGSEDFQACLADQGVDIPDPGSGGGPPSGGVSSKLQKAFEACQDKLPAGVGPGGGGPPNLDQNGSVPDTQQQ
ncbi:MAG: hypothetical protein H0T69_09795 [Thermoleophilaceae bacterium]|nr:hypothetical protein [Thermoleophilaceae bacterium]